MTVSYRQVGTDVVEPWTAQATREGLTFKPDTLFIGALLDDDTLAGFGGLKLRGRQATLRNLYVRPEYRGQGIARALILHRLTWAKQAGATSAVVFSNSNSRPILESLGAVVLDERRYYGKLRFDLAQ